MNYWQMSGETDKETVKSRCEPVVKFSYTNSDKTVTPTSDKKWTSNSYSVTGLSDHSAENEGLYMGSSTESFYSASKPHCNETNAQNGTHYTETHFNGSYDFQNGGDHSRGSPNMEGSFQGMFSPRDNENTSVNNVKPILFKQCTYEERQDEINRLLRNNAKNEKFIQVISDEDPRENRGSLISYRESSNSGACGNREVFNPVKSQELFAPPTSDSTSSITIQDSTPGAVKHRNSTDSEIFESDIFPKMTKVAVEKVKKVSMEVQSEDNSDSRPDSPIDFLSRRAIFESNNSLADVYKNRVFRPVKMSKTPPKLNSTSDKKEGNNFMTKYLGNVTVPFKFPELGSFKKKSFFGKSQKSTSPQHSRISSKSPDSEHSRQNTFSSKTTKNNSQSQQTVSSSESTKYSAPSYQKGACERNQKTSNNLSRYGISVQEDKLLRQTANSRKNEKTSGGSFVVNDDDKSSDYDSRSTSMETVIDCSSPKNPERCSSVDTGLHKIGKYNRKVADIVRLFDEMVTQQNIPDGYYTWQDYKMKKSRGLSRWDESSKYADMSKSYSNIVELQRTDSPLSRSDFNISNLSSSYVTPAPQIRSRPQSVDVYESSRNESRYQEQSYDVTRERDSSPYFEKRPIYDTVSPQDRPEAAYSYHGFVSPKLVSNLTNSELSSQEMKVNNSLFHDERRSAFERHTPAKLIPEHHYENVLYSSTDSSQNSYRIEGNESSFINTQQMSGLVCQSEPRVAEQSIEKGQNYYIASTTTQSRLTPVADPAKYAEENGRSRASTQTKSRTLVEKDKSLTRKPRVVTWDLNTNHSTPRFRSHSADPYEMRRKSAMRSKAPGGSNLNLSGWRMSSSEPSPHFLNLTADAKRKTESYPVNSDQKLLNILFENLMENKYLNRTSRLKQNQEVVEQSKFMKDRDKEISQGNTTNYDSFTKMKKSTSATDWDLSSMNRVYGSSVSGMKSVGRSSSPCISEMTQFTPNGRSFFSDGNASKIRTRTNSGEETRTSKRCTVTNNQNDTSYENVTSNHRHQPTATYGESFTRSSRCDSPRILCQKRNCRIVSSPVNMGSAKINYRDEHSRTIQTETKSVIQSYNAGNTIQSSDKVLFTRSSQSTDSPSAYPWRDKRVVTGSPSYSSRRDMIESPTYSSRIEMMISPSYNAKREIAGSPSNSSKRELICSLSYGSKKDMIARPSYNARAEIVGKSSHSSKRDMIWSPSYGSKRDLIASPSYKAKTEIVGSSSQSSKRDMIGIPAYGSNRDMIGSPSYDSKRNEIASPSYNAKTEIVGSSPRSSKRGMIASPSYNAKTEVVGISSRSSNRDMIGSPAYGSKRDVVAIPSYVSKRDMIVNPSFNAKTEILGRSSHSSKRELIWSPPCTSPPAPFRVLSPASSIAFDERAFSPRVTSPFRVITPCQGNSVINMQTISRSESALSARNTPLSESCVLRFITGNTDGMSDIEYRRQMYLNSVEVDSSPPAKYQQDTEPVVPVSSTAEQQARRI